MILIPRDCSVYSRNNTKLIEAGIDTSEHPGKCCLHEKSFLAIVKNES